MIILIDNYDSFTYNVKHYFNEIGAEVETFRNDKITLNEIEEINPKAIVLSPGPCTPNEAGISLNLINKFKDKFPILGICLGHQSIGQAFGSKIIKCEEIMHGKIDSMMHYNQPILMDEFKKNFIEGLKQKKPQLLTNNLIADVETPISCLLKIQKNQKYSFLLESVEGGSLRGRYSLLGCDPDIIWKVENNSAEIIYNYENYNYDISNKPIDSLKNLIDLSKFDRGKIEVPYPILVGYLGYPMIKFMEQIELKNPDNINIPDSVLIRPKVVTVFDNIKDSITVMTIVYPSNNINHAIFKDIDKKFFATRYHSLVIDRNTLSDNFIITAETEKKIIMGIAHINLPIYGFQFHPESIGTKYGKKLLKNFLNIINYGN